MKMENRLIPGTVKIMIRVIVSAMSVNHHRVLYLTLTLSKSGILVLSVLTMRSTSASDSFYQISWIP